jgi:hypothetical protein
MATIPSSQNNDSRFVVQIGQDHFWIEVWMYNFLSNYPPIQIPFFFINQLVIEETLADWNIKGFIVLENDYEILERGSPNYVGDSSSVKDSPTYKAPYLFRTDGRNKLNIRIHPYRASKDDISDILPMSHWEMNYDLVVYDVQDLSVKEAGKKKRAFYFKDERHQIFSERNIEWSTSMRSPIGSKDADRTMFGNDAVKDVINTAGTLTGTPVKVGFTSKGSIDKPDLLINNIDNNLWAASPNDPNAKIFYTSPSNHSVLDDLNYLLRQTKAADGSPVILETGRTQDDKNWKLISLAQIFKGSQKNQIERLIINDGVDPTNFPPSLQRADGTKSSAIRNFTSGTASIIKDYQYSPMVSTDDSLICNSPLFNYNFAENKYNVYFEKNTISNVLDSASKMVQNGLFNFSSNSNGQLQLNVNKTKQLGIMTKNYFTPKNFFLKDYPLMNMLKDFVFLSGSIYFRVNGLTIRTPGKFVYIDKLAAGDKNGFDDRFLGQWLLTKVTHFFSKGGYINDVIATKVDSYSKIFPDSKGDKSY